MLIANSDSHGDSDSNSDSKRNNNNNINNNSNRNKSINLNSIEFDNGNLLLYLWIIFTIYLQIIKNNHFQRGFSHKNATFGFHEVNINMSTLQ